MKIPLKLQKKILFFFYRKKCCWKNPKKCYSLTLPFKEISVPPELSSPPHFNRAPKRWDRWDRGPSQFDIWQPLLASQLKLAFIDGGCQPMMSFSPKMPLEVHNK